MRSGDLPDLLSLWNDAAVYDPMSNALLAEKTLQDPDFDTQLCLVATLDGAIAGFSMGVVRHLEKAASGFIKLLAVAPKFQRQGIGRHLLDKTEQTLAAKKATHIRVGESAPNYLTPGVDERYKGASHLFLANAYQPVGTAYNLSIDLQRDDDDGAELQELCVRRAMDADKDALWAFLGERWPSWSAEVAVALGNRPCSVYVALSGERIIGFAAYDANNYNTGWFGPMGVDAEERGSGAGCVLLKRCLDDIRAQGHVVATIPWAAALPFYERCAGARTARTFQRFEKVLRI